MPQLLDFNQCVISSVHVAQAYTDEPTVDHVRNYLLNSFAGFNSKFREKYGNIVICCDDTHSWRKDVFPYYKAKRKSNRASSPIRWDLVFECIALFKDEIRNYLPYKVIDVPSAEGDDIIAAITKYLQTNELQTKGLIEEPQPIMILSTDTDFIQLHKFPNVKQWAPRQKKFVTHPDPEQYLREKLFRGDTGDGVPNFLTSDDVLVTPGVKSSKIMEEKLNQWIKLPLESVLDNEVKKRNYYRNKKMIDLIESIPTELEEKIISKYKTTKAASSMKIMSYLIEYQLKNVSENAKFL